MSWRLCTYVRYHAEERAVWAENSFSSVCFSTAHLYHLMGCGSDCYCSEVILCQLDMSRGLICKMFHKNLTCAVTCWVMVWKYRCWVTVSSNSSIYDCVHTMTKEQTLPGGYNHRVTSKPEILNFLYWNEILLAEHLYQIPLGSTQCLRFLYLLDISININIL